MRVVWQCEVDPYACRVLAKHWPDVPNLGDITTVDWSTVEPPDVVCGGYPCQPFSLAGTRRGEDDPRHLWPWMRDAIRLLRPRYALLENVPGHLALGFGRVLGELAELGYDCEWDCIPAAAVGAPHLRYRIFIVARDTTWIWGRRESRPKTSIPDVADSGSARRRQDPRSTPGDEAADAGWTAANHHILDSDGQSSRAGDVADTESIGRSGCGFARPDMVNDGPQSPHSDERTRGDGDWWAVEPDVGRVAHGVPSRMDRLRCLGNAVVPQVAEFIGRRILEAVDAAS